jgi:GMC oxidoreductase/UvrD-like helicase C-terminal domain
LRLLQERGASFVDVQGLGGPTSSTDASSKRIFVGIRQDPIRCRLGRLGFIKPSASRTRHSIESVLAEWLGDKVEYALKTANIPFVRTDPKALVRRNSRLARLIEACARWVTGGWRDADPAYARLLSQAVSLVFGRRITESEEQQFSTRFMIFLNGSIATTESTHTWLLRLAKEVIEPWRAIARNPEQDWDVCAEMISNTDPARDLDIPLAHFAGRIEGTGRVNLTTLHSAKGREFDAVVMYGINSNEFPSYRDRKTPSALRDARRSFYVGVTRPRKELSRAFHALAVDDGGGRTGFSARLLMLSGVGDAKQLRKLGIKPVADLRGVGANLQDHVIVSGVVYQYKGKMPDRPADSNAVEAEVYLSSGIDGHATDINLVLEQLPLATPEAAARFGAPPKEGFTIAPALVQPTSRGRVRLVSADWRDAPVIEGNHLGTDRDLIAIVRAIQAARELGSKAAFDGIREAEIVPGPKATNRQDLIDFARTGAASFGHAVGTARIGTGRDAVVDSELRVHGLRGLRVADASVMPSIISGPTNAAAFMIGGRAAELIKAAK